MNVQAILLAATEFERKAQLCIDEMYSANYIDNKMKAEAMLRRARKEFDADLQKAAAAEGKEFVPDARPPVEGPQQLNDGPVGDLKDDADFLAKLAEYEQNEDVPPPAPMAKMPGAQKPAGKGRRK